MRLTTMLPLLTILLLQGCNLKDIGLEDKKKATAEVVTSTELQAFLDSFVLLQNQELILDKLATDIMGDSTSSVAGVVTNTTTTGVCLGTAVLSADLTAASGAFDNSLTLTNYCTDSPDLTGFTGTFKESGVITGAGTDETAYTLSFPNYIYTVTSSDSFTITLVGSETVAVGTDKTTRYLNQISLFKNPGSLAVEAQNWLAATYATGTVYTGNIIHPTYGTVALSTEPTYPVTTSSDGATKRPISGKLKLMGLDSIGYITFNGLGSYTLDVDSNADGTIDLTETMSW